MDYRKKPALNNSGMNALAISPSHYQAWINQSFDTPALRFGRAVHTMFLEPYKFSDEYVIENPRTKAAQADSRDAISRNDYQTIMRMNEQLHFHDVVWEIMQGASVEVDNFWQDDDSGADCKGRADIVGKDRIIWDLKTTSNVTDFEYSIRKYNYDRQAAFYLDGFNARGFGWIVIEKTVPFGIRIIRASNATIESGREKYKPLAALYAKCCFTGEWPGLPNIIEEI